MTTGLDLLITIHGTCLQALGEVRSGYTGNRKNEAFFVPIQFFSYICSLLNSCVAFQILVLQIRFFNFGEKNDQKVFD